MKQNQRTEPKLRAAGESPAALDPRSIRFYLFETENEAPAQRIERLTELLDGLRTSSLSPKPRFRSIEFCAREAAKLRRDLNRSLAGLTLPLPGEKDALSRKHARTHRLLAECCMGVATELAGGDRHGASETGCLLRSCYAAIEHFGQSLLITYERYSKVGSGVWLDIHKTYNLAAAEDMQNVRLDRQTRPPQTVEHIYKRVLLLGLSDPFHHPFRSLASVYEKLDEWASLATLTTTSADSSRCLFTVDPALDRPAMPALSRSRIRPQFNERWLNTRQLVDHLKKQHHTAAKTTIRQLDQSRSITAELDSIEQLRRMVVHWGIHPIRNAERRSTYECCDMVIGLKSVCSALNDFEPLAVERAAPESPVVSMMKGRFDKAQSKAVDNTQISNQWEIADESERGFKVLADTTEGCPGVSVGELVAVRTESSGNWTIGSVHWAQTDDHSRLSLGIKRIHFTAQPAAVFRLQTDRTLDHTRCAALLLYNDSSDSRNVSLICDKSLYFPTATYLVRHDKGRSERVVEASKVLLTSRSFVWFDAREPQAGTRQRALDLIYPK